MDLVTKDLRIVVSDDEGKLGELAISKGPIEWWSRYAKNSSRLQWRRYDTVMRENGRMGQPRPWRPIKARRVGARKPVRRKRA
jgi:hypothetical protein